jgi:hypothetical protein
VDEGIVHDQVILLHDRPDRGDVGGMATDKQERVIHPAKTCDFSLQPLVKWNFASNHSAR